MFHSGTPDPTQCVGGRDSLFGRWVSAAGRLAASPGGPGGPYGVRRGGGARTAGMHTASEADRSKRQRFGTTRTIRQSTHMGNLAGSRPLRLRRTRGEGEPLARSTLLCRGLDVGTGGLGCGAPKSGGAGSWPVRGSAAGFDVHHGVRLKNLPGTRGQARATNMERGVVGIPKLGFSGGGYDEAGVEE